jgi:multidrug resistance protein
VKRAPLNVIFAIVFLDLVGFGIVIPLLPLYAQHYHPGKLQFGMLLASYSAMQFLFAPILGKLSDRFGRKPVLLLSLAGSVAGYLLFAFARSLLMLFVARIIDGISGGNISTAQAYVADVTPPQERARAMGRIGAAFGIGFIFGPAIAGVALHFGPAAPGIAAAALSALALVATAATLKETAPSARQAAINPLDPAGFVAALRRPGLAVLLATFFLITFAFANFEATFAQFLHDQFHVSDSGVAFYFVLAGVLISATQGGLIGPLTRWLGERRLVVLGTALVAGSLLFLPLSTAPVAVMLILVPLTIGMGSTNPSLSSLVSKAAPERERGGVFGAYQSMSSLGRILGPLWAEPAYFRFGGRGPHWSGLFAAGSACVLFVWLRRDA